MNKNVIGFLVVLIAVGVIAYFFGWPKSFAPVTEEEQVFCTMDAMQCPDGTWVGRTGPNCEFVCPGV